MSRLNILMADDDALVRAVVAEEIAEAGHSVRAVRNGEAVLNALDEDTFDIILIDCAMPDMMGPKIARRVREKWPQQAVAMLSGDDTPPDNVAAAQGFPIIPKSRMSALLKAVVAIAEGERPPPASTASRWDEIRRRMAATANSRLVAENLRSLYADPVDAPLPQLLEALLGETSKEAPDEGARTHDKPAV